MSAPLRIEMDLAGPMERPADPIHFDGLIAHLLVKRDLPADATIDRIRTTILALPLERRETGGDWTWAASTIAFEWTSPPMHGFATLAIRAAEISRFQETGAFTNRKPETKIDTSKSTFKAGVWARERQWAARAVAFCIGDEEEVRDLLSRLEQIGPRRRLGAGMVTGTRVVVDGRAHDLWSRRSLPLHDGLGRLAEGSYRLPAFDVANRTIVRTRPLEWRDAT